MKAFFYVWCLMAAACLVALFFNHSHVVTCCISLLMAYATHPEDEQKNKGDHE